MRICGRCGETKPLDRTFFIPRKSDGGFESACRACRQEQARDAYARNPEQSARRTRRWRKRNPEKAKQAFSKWPAAHVEETRLMAKAHTAVMRAVAKGILVRPPECEECGKACRTEAAHFNYVERLRVRWLCRGCHMRWDRADPKHRSIETSEVAA